MPAFKAMNIACHDQALRLILKSIAKGEHGGYYTIAEIGRTELIEDMGGQCQEDTIMAAARLVLGKSRHGSSQQEQAQTRYSAGGDDTV